jgi:hypothetical protein
MGFGTRTPTSNDPPRPNSSPWGADEYLDDVALLLNALGARCAGCGRVTKNQHLREELGKKYCPGCKAT